jgi:predicted transcriptional regulator
MSTHGPEKNIALAPDLLAEVEKLASSEHRTTDEIMNEAARKYLDVQRTIADLDSFVARNRKEAIKKGWTERSISTVVKKHRQEKRGL